MTQEPQEDLAALVIADPFEFALSFGPIVRGDSEDPEALPWSLIPLAGVPLISWTLESLASSGVQKVFVFIRNGINEVQEWFKTCRFANDPLFNVNFQRTNALSVGDVFREADSLSLGTDFVVARVGYVGTLDLSQHVTNFAKKRESNRNLIMETLVTSNPIATCSPYSSVHILSPTNSILYYEQHPLYPLAKRSTVPRHILEENKNVILRSDLDTVGVQICNREVPALFSENFDYQSIEPDFINGIITSDLLDKTISCTIIGEPETSTKTSISSTTSTSTTKKLDSKPHKSQTEWATLVKNTRSFDAVSKAIFSRWTYPLVPDGNLPGSTDRYEHRRSRLYVGRSVQLARSCNLGQLTLLGHYSSIGGGSIIAGSVIDSNCQINSNCTIIDSHIMKGARIMEGCVIKRSIIGPNTIIGKNSCLEPGSIVGPNTILGQDAHLYGIRVAHTKWEQGEIKVSPQDAMSWYTQKESNLGKDQDNFQVQAYLWPAAEREKQLLEMGDDDDDDWSDDEDQAQDVRNIRVGQLGVELGHMDNNNEDLDDNNDLDDDASSVSSISLASSTDDDDDYSKGFSQENSFDQEYSSDDDADKPDMIEAMDSLAQSSSLAAFEAECLSSINRSIAEQHTIENASIELKTLRMASNVTLHNVRGVVIPRLCRIVLDDLAETSPSQSLGDLIRNSSAKQLYGLILKVFNRWGDLILTLGGDDDEGMKSTALNLQQFCAKLDHHVIQLNNDEDKKDIKTLASRLFPYYLRAFYDQDVLSEDAIVEWFKSPESRSNDLFASIRISAAPFVKALVEAESESEDDEDDDE